MGSFGENTEEGDGIRREALSQAANETLEQIPQRLEEMHGKEWPAVLVLDLVRSSFVALRASIDDPDEAELSWTRPWAELRIPADWNFDTPPGEESAVFSKTLPVPPEGEEDKFFEQLSKVAYSQWEQAFLSSLTNSVVIAENPDGTRELLVPDHLRAELELDDLPDEERAKALDFLSRPFSWGAVETEFEEFEDLEEGERKPLSPEFVADLYDRLRPAIQFTATSDEGFQFGWGLVFQCSPLTLDEAAREAFFRVTVGLQFWPLDPEEVGRILDDRGGTDGWLPPGFDDESAGCVWDATFKGLDELLEAIRGFEKFAGAIRESASKKVETLEARPAAVVVRSYRQPRGAGKDSAAVARFRGAPFKLTGTGRRFPDLGRERETACEKAESLFWEAFEATLDEETPGWTKEANEGRTVVTLPVQEAAARDLWDKVTNDLNATKGGPGVRVANPEFKSANYFAAGKVVVQTKVSLWPEGNLFEALGGRRVPVLFRKTNSPGYLKLLAEKGKRGFFAEGFFFQKRNGGFEGFRIGGLPSLLFPKRQEDLANMAKEKLEALEQSLQELVRNPSLFREGDARERRELQDAIEATRADLQRRRIFSRTQDLMDLVWAAFDRQKFNWWNERLELEDGRVIQTQPNRAIRLDPEEVRKILDPHGEWGKRWRTRLFERLEVLTYFERTFRNAKMEAKESPGRFLEKIIDGKQRPPKEADKGVSVGLTKVLAENWALPCESFFVVVSTDFVERRYEFARDEKGELFLGSAAGDATKRRLLKEGKPPKEAHGEAKTVRERARGKNYVERHELFLFLASQEKWPLHRTNLVREFQDERTPNRVPAGEGRWRRAKNALGGKDKLERIGDRDFISCNGSSGRGYKVKTWLDRADYPKKGREGLRLFVEDLEALAESIGLRFVVRNLEKRQVRDAHAVAVLRSYASSTDPEWRGFNLQAFLPADWEASIRARLLEVHGIATTDTEPPRKGDKFSPRRPGGIAPLALRIARQKAGWKQSDLAEKLGVSQATVANWERGKKPIPRDREQSLREVLDGFLEDLGDDLAI